MELANQLSPQIKGKFNIALTESNFQKLADKASALLLNEDNLSEIKLFLDNVRDVERNIEKTHKAGKEESLRIGKQWDLGKNTFLNTVAAIKEKPQSEYTKICKDIQERQLAAQRDLDRKRSIMDAIEMNAIDFAKRIALCNTTADLLSIERLINLEKSRKEKYDEFLEEAVSRLAELNQILTSQKALIKDAEEAEKKLAKAKENGDEQAIIDLQEQTDLAKIYIEEKKVEVQEAAVNQSIYSPQIIEAEIVFPTIKARRTTWKYEVVNEKDVMKKSPELVVFSIDDIKVKANLKLLKETQQLEGKKELIINGIRYFEESTF
jgi:hypothetical protein